MLTEGRTTDAGVTGILIAHLGAFSSGELIRKMYYKENENNIYETMHLLHIFYSAQIPSLKEIHRSIMALTHGHIRTLRLYILFHAQLT